MSSLGLGQMSPLVSSGGGRRHGEAVRVQGHGVVYAGAALARVVVEVRLVWWGATEETVAVAVAVVMIVDTPNASELGKRS